ncbi:MAG TPA: hypothetical protein VL651_17470, partial [Bacteroidia bacterium]|nr:hypothetical protein [Bacteroidia bacterium]
KTSVILSGQKRMIGIKGSQQIVLGWNDEVMFAVFAISDEDSLKVADACVKLLTTTPGSSLLNNENFITHEKCSFDLGLWINTDEVLAFTGGGKMFRNMFYNTKYISIACDLNKGEIAARRTITYKTPVIPTEENTLLSSDENSTTGFVNFPFHFDTEDAIENTFDVFPLDQLPFDDEHDSALAKTMGTGCTVLLHDTFPSHENFISYSYDEDFNQLAVQSSRSVTAFGTTVCIPLKDAKATQQIIDEQMKANSIPSVNGVYTIDENGMEYRLFIADGILYWTNWKNADGKERAIPDNWSGMQMRVKPSPWLRSEKSEMISFIFPDPQKARSILADQLKEIVLTQTVNSGTQGSDEFRLFFNNEKINALIQLSEIGRKLMK